MDVKASFSGRAVLTSRQACQCVVKACRFGVRLLCNILSPESCAACDAPIETSHVFCSRCGACPDAAAHVPAVCAHVGGSYSPPLSTAIKRFKFSHRADLARPLARLLPWPFDDSGSTPVQRVVVPVPLHYERLVERGFNPAGLLGHALARRAGADFCPELLQRPRATAQQSRLPARERRANVAGAFRAANGARGRQVVLVDDVVTTGSTLEACRHALYAAGVDHVTVIALAAAPPGKAIVPPPCPLKHP